MQTVASVPHVVQDTYRVERLLARGGMGAVYRARDLPHNRLVALKTVRAELVGDTEGRTRFCLQAQVVARIQHPAIVSILDCGTLPGGGAFLVMELVAGDDLRRVLQREGRIEAHRAMTILSTVCAGMDAAHREGVRHGDLKPENIILPPGGVAAKVLDFGLASLVRDGTREAEMIIGTPAYMAPEQLSGVAPDERGDIFSLGVVAFEMLTGELPFGRGSLTEIVLAHARGIAPTRYALPASLEHAVMAALKADPDRRPPTARAFAQLLAS